MAIRALTGNGSRGFGKIRLQQHLATHVTVHHGTKKGGGRIEIEYYGTDDLQRIVTALGVAAPGGLND